MVAIWNMIKWLTIRYLNQMFCKELMVVILNGYNFQLKIFIKSNRFDKL